jgi:DNA transformation protein
MSKNLQETLQKELRNIGPEMAAKLLAAGIDSPEKLRRLGAKKAFLKLHETRQFCGKYNAAYLYALEGAIRDCDWRAIPEPLKCEFKKYTAELRRR